MRQVLPDHRLEGRQGKDSREEGWYEPRAEWTELTCKVIKRANSWLRTLCFEHGLTTGARASSGHLRRCSMMYKELE
eukprot:scaffold1065_cov114-Skeletonema_dohrnii-CCMP3373.AAC.11